jgi:hypothetical protein
MRLNLKDLFVGAILVLVAVVSRVWLHLPNFAAMAAVGLFAGFYFKSNRAVIIPLLAVLISDLFIGMYDLGVMAFVYLAWMVPVSIGKSDFAVKGINKIAASVLTIGSKSLLASLAFYLISNFGVWLFSGMYAVSFSGLLECYSLAVPFFRATILGDLAFSGALFGSYFLIEFLFPTKHEVATVKVRK